MKTNILLISLFLFCASQRVSAQSNRIFIGDNNNGRIISCKLDGSDITELSGGRYQSYYDADLDPVDEKLYMAWYYGIYSMNYDGSDFDTLIDYQAGGYSNGVAVDHINRHLFWSSIPEKKIYRSDLDGSNQITIATVAGSLGDVSLDLKNSHVYYTVAFGTGSGIYRTNLDGSSPITLLSGSVGYPVEVDSKNNFVYFTQGSDTRRMNTDMSNNIVVMNTVAMGIYADTANNKLYLTTGALVSCDPDGANAINLITSGLSAPFRPVLFYQCEPTTGTATITACDSLVWIDGITYKSDNNTATFKLTNSHGCDSTVTLNLSINHSSSATQTISACYGFVWIDGNAYYADNNTATYIIPNASGCDSLITLDLTIQVVDDSVIQNGNVLKAHASGADYKWVDCDNNYLPIQGATDSVFTATVNGNYALIVGQGACIDTSDCITVSGLGIDSRKTKGAITLSPNPAGKEVFFSATVNVVVINITGQVVQTASDVNSIDISVQPAGIYFFLLSDTNGQLLQRSKIVKE